MSVTVVTPAGEAYGSSTRQPEAEAARLRSLGWCVTVAGDRIYLTSSKDVDFGAFWRKLESKAGA